MEAPAGAWALEMTAVTAEGEHVFVPLTLDISR